MMLPLPPWTYFRAAAMCTIQFFYIMFDTCYTTEITSCYVSKVKRKLELLLRALSVRSTVQSLYCKIIDNEYHLCTVLSLLIFLNYLSCSFLPCVLGMLEVNEKLSGKFNSRHHQQKTIESYT